MDLDAYVGSLRAILTGPWIRRVGGIRDLGEVVLAKIGNIDGGAHVEAEDGRKDLWVHCVEILSGVPHIARLAAAGNALWRKPGKGDSTVVLRFAGADGPGVPVAMHGDGGAAGDVPEELTDDNMVLSPPKGDILIRSRDGQVWITAAGDKPIRLIVSGTGTVQVGGDGHPLPLWDTFLSDFATFLGDVIAGTVGGPTKQLPQNAASIAAFLAKVQAATYNSTVAENG